MHIKIVEKNDLEQLRLIRNKWHKLGIFRQNHDITKEEQILWFKNNKKNPGYIINGRAYGKIFNDNEIAFYGFDEWHVKDLKDFINFAERPFLFGEAYQMNQFLVPIWLEAGFKVDSGMRNRKYWQGRMWDSLMLKWEIEQ